MKSGNIAENIQQAAVLLAKYAKTRPDGTDWINQPLKILVAELMLDMKQAHKLIKGLVDEGLIESYYPFFTARLISGQRGGRAEEPCAVPGNPDTERKNPAKIIKTEKMQAAGGRKERQYCPPTEIDILAAYEMYGGDANRAADVLQRRVLTVLNCWKKAGLVAKGNSSQTDNGKKDGVQLMIIDKRKLPQSDVDKIIAAHAECNGNASKAAKMLKRCIGTVIQYWKEAGLVAKGNTLGSRSLLQSDVDKIIAAHAECNGNASKAAKMLKRCVGTVLRHWKKAGLVVRSKEKEKKEEKKVLEKKTSIALAGRPFAGLIESFCRLYGLTPKELKSAAREKRVVWPRQILMFVLREETHYSCKEIAKALAMKSHSTAVKACIILRKEMENSESLREEVGRIRRIVRTALSGEVNNSEIAAAKDTVDAKAEACSAPQLIKAKSPVAKDLKPAVLAEGPIIYVHECECSAQGAISLLKREGMAAFEALSAKLLPALDAYYKVVIANDRMLILEDQKRCGCYIIFGGGKNELAALNQVALCYKKIEG